MKMKQVFPELRQDIHREDVIRALVNEAELGRFYLDRKVDTSFVELKDNINYFYDLSQAVSYRLATAHPQAAQRGGLVTKSYQAIPDDREFIALVQALGPLANKPWRQVRNSLEWKALPGGISSRITSARNAYVRCQRDVLTQMCHAFMYFTARAFDFGQVTSYLCDLQGFPSTRYPVGGLLNPVLNEHEYHLLVDTPNLACYRDAVVHLRNYGPGIRHWKQLSLRNFISAYVGVRNAVFRNLNHRCVIETVEKGILEEIFRTECAEIAVARKFQDLPALQAALPPISRNTFLNSMKDMEAKALSFDMMHEIMGEMGAYFGPMKEMVAILSDSASAEIAVARGK